VRPADADGNGDGAGGTTRLRLFSGRRRRAVGADPGRLCPTARGTVGAGGAQGPEAEVGGKVEIEVEVDGVAVTGAGTGTGTRTETVAGSDVPTAGEAGAVSTTGL
jgi:hypothetical protein